MRYITIIDGIEEECVTDEQEWKCINEGGQMYSIDDSGERTLVAENGRFVMGRPVFPNPPIDTP